MFFVEAQPMAAGSSLQISGDEAHHAMKALRMQAGERLIVTDGMGKSAEAVITGIGTQLDIQLGTVHNEPRPALEFTVVQALPKSDRGELAVELLTEVGVNSIVPWHSARCVSVWRDDKKRMRGQQKWQSSARTAAKQSRRVWWPQVHEVVDTSQVEELVGKSDVAVVLHEGAQQSLVEVQAPLSGLVTLMVGPEGGLDDAEVARLSNAGAQVCRMGPTVMRTSTAGAVGVAVLMSKSARWSR